MANTVKCPRCRMRFCFKATLSGKHVDCPNCGQRILIPELHADLESSDSLATKERARSLLDESQTLIEKGEVDKALRQLEECVSCADEIGDATLKAKAIGTMADAWGAKGDIEQAIRFQRQALQAFDTIPDAKGSAICHAQIASYLVRCKAWQEAGKHLLAAILYFMTFEPGGMFWTMAWENFIEFRYRARGAGQRFVVPRVAELLQLPEFGRLMTFLKAHKKSIEGVQGLLDNQIHMLIVMAGH